MSFTDIAAIVGAFVILVGLIATAFGVSAFDVSQKVTHTTQIRPLHRLDGPDEDKSDETQEDVS